MWEAIIGLTSGTIGAIAGSGVTWVMTTRMVRNQSRREVLVEAIKALQDFRVSYAHWYVEYLSPQARAAGRDWAGMSPGPSPDPVYLELMGAADRDCGRLRVISGLLYAHFPLEEITPLYQEIQKILLLTSVTVQTDCRHIEHLAESTCQMIPDLILKYSGLSSIRAKRIKSAATTSTLHTSFRNGAIPTGNPVSKPTTEEDNERGSQLPANP